MGNVHEYSILVEKMRPFVCSSKTFICHNILSFLFNIAIDNLMNKMVKLVQLHGNIRQNWVIIKIINDLLLVFFFFMNSSFTTLHLTRLKTDWHQLLKLILQSLIFNKMCFISAKFSCSTSFKWMLTAVN